MNKRSKSIASSYGFNQSIDHIALDKGKTLEEWTYNDFMAKNGIFAQLTKRQ